MRAKTSTNDPNTQLIPVQVTHLLADIRRGLGLCGVEHEHLDDHQLFEWISFAYLQLELSGQPMTREAWFAAMGIIAAPVEVES